VPRPCDGWPDARPCAFCKGEVLALIVQSGIGRGIDANQAAGTTNPKTPPLKIEAVKKPLEK